MSVALRDSQKYSDVVFTEVDSLKTKNFIGLELLAKKGCVDAQFELAELYQNSDSANYDIVLSVHWYKKAAEQGHCKAQYCLGVIYKQGRGVPVDFSKAFRWYKKSADQGMSQAQNNLACLYFYGQGVEVNIEEALALYKKSAEKETAKAQYNLGLIYEQGLGIEPDMKEGDFWYRKSAKNGYSEAIQAINRVASSYSQPDLIEPTVKLVDAIEYSDATEFWLAEIVAQTHKNDDSKENFINKAKVAPRPIMETKKDDEPLNEAENRVPVDSQQVQESVTEVTWFIDKAEKGSAEAQYSLAVMYEYGLLVEQDYMESIFWYKKAANQGYPDAQNQLGEMYKADAAVKMDLVESYYWLSLAKKSTKFHDIDLIAIEKTMTIEQISQAKLKISELAVLSMSLI